MPFGSLKAVISRAGKGAPAAPTAETARYLEILTNPDAFTPPLANASKLLKLYRASPWVRSITGKVAGAVARQAFYLETLDGERIDKHPFLGFIRAGSPRLRGRQAIKALQLHLDLAGEAFAAIGRNGATPVQWAPIPPHWVTDLPRANFDFYEIQPTTGNGQRFHIPAADVLAFRDVDPLAPYERGTGVTEAAWTEVQSDEAAAEFLYSFFKNRTRPDLLISGTKERPLSDKDVPRLETTWRERFRGAAKAFRPFFSTHPLEVKEWGKGLRDNDVSTIRDQLKATISEVYGVPPEILGRLDNSNRATIDAADYLFGKHTIDPRLSFLVDVLEPFGLEWFNLGDLVLRYESPIPEDTSHRLEVMKAFSGKFTGNEKRALAGLRPRDEPEFDLPDVENAPDPNAAGSATNDNTDPEDDPNDTPPKGGKKAAPAVVERVISPSEIVSVSEAHTDPQVRAEVSRILDDIFGKLLNRYGSELLEALSVEVKFDTNVRVANWLADEVPGLLGHIDETTRKELAAAMVDGAAKGENLAALLARVDGVFKDAADTRAPLIGDTMATKITGFASQDAAEQAGFERKMWLSSQDQIVRGSHRSMNRQVVGTKEKFRSPRGGAAMHPGAFGEASEDVNCRCAMRPILPGEDTSKSADAPDVAAFLELHDKQWSHISGKITERVRDVFAGQAAVCREALRRAFIGREVAA